MNPMELLLNKLGNADQLPSSQIPILFMVHYIYFLYSVKSFVHHKSGLHINHFNKIRNFKVYFHCYAISIISYHLEISKDSVQTLKS